MAGNIPNIMSVNELEAAARMADIESLYRVIEQDRYVLEHIDSVPFEHTLLHLVASVDLPGHTQFATEIMILKPSLALKLNLEGLTPIHLAVQSGCNRMALRLVHFNKDLVRAKMRGGFTPLHLASQSGDIGLLTEFLRACPDSIEDETGTGETALHLAVKYNSEAFKFLVKWLKEKTPKLERTILNRKDEDGNTILHIAALNNATEVIEFLRKRVTIHVIDFDAENLRGQTALNLSRSAHVRTILDQVRVCNRERIGWILSYIIWSFYEKIVQFVIGGPMTEEDRNTYLVVATLISTTTYQSTLSPPGGFHQSNAVGTIHTHLPSNSSTEGKSVMSFCDFDTYTSTNMYAFLASTATIMFMLPTRLASFLLYAANFLLIYSFYLSINIISPPDIPPFSKSLWFAAVIIVIIMVAMIFILQK